jgi:Cdc6-like AAA superfamily ATPase
MYNFTPLLERTVIKNEISSFLKYFDENKTKTDIKRSLWVYGSSGVGKTSLIKETLKELNYDIIYYNSAHIRNKNMIEEMNTHLASPVNVYSMFFGKPKQIVVVMDEIESMNLMDKHGVGALLQIIRPKKTEKQKQYNYTTVPIICISNECEDKRLKEMRKQSISLHIKRPTNVQINKITQMKIVFDFSANFILYFITCWFVHEGSLC